MTYNTGLDKKETNDTFFMSDKNSCFFVRTAVFNTKNGEENLLFFAYETLSQRVKSLRNITIIKRCDIFYVTIHTAKI